MWAHPGFPKTRNYQKRYHKPPLGYETENSLKLKTKPQASTCFCRIFHGLANSDYFGTRPLFDRDGQGYRGNPSLSIPAKKGREREEKGKKWRKSRELAANDVDGIRKTEDGRYRFPGSDYLGMNYWLDDLPSPLDKRDMGELVK